MARISFKRNKKRLKQADINDRQRKNLQDETQEKSPEERVFEKLFAKNLIEKSLTSGGRRSSRESKTYTLYTKEQIENYIASPTTNEKNLREASTYMYYIKTRYRNLIQYFPSIPKWYYIITPVDPSQNYSKNSFLNSYKNTLRVISSMQIPKSMTEICTIALREGVCYAAIWGSGKGDGFFFQQLNPDYCQISTVTDGNVFGFKFDMSKINEADLDSQYPPGFRDLYNKYGETGEAYQQVPYNLGFCIKADPTVLAYSIPPFSGLLPTLHSLQKTESLAESADELANYKLLAGKIPTDEQGHLLMSEPEVMSYYQHICNNIGDRVGVAVTPFDLKDYTFEQSGTAAQINITSRANENFFEAAGTSALLHGATNNTSGVTKLAIKVDEAYAFKLMEQCAGAINRYLKTLSGTVKFKIEFLPVSIFNEEEKMNAYKNAMNYGMGKLQYAACVGMNQTSLEGQAYIENEILGFNDIFIPMKTASTQSSSSSPDSEENKAGRPTEENVTPEGEKSRESSGDYE